MHLKNKIINIFVRFFPPHRSFYERDDKLTPCLIEIKFMDNDHGYVPLDVNTSRSFPHSRLITGFIIRLTRRVPLVEQDLLTLPEHMSSASVLTGVRVTRSLDLYVCFVDRCLSFCTFSFDHCVACSSSICGFWLSLWYLQTLLKDMLDCAQKISTPFGSNYFTSI
jgi:hypothetical protein